MILKIGFDKDRVIQRADDHILVHIPNYVNLNRGCYLITAEGSSREEFEDPTNQARSGQTVLISQRGGIVIEPFLDSPTDEAELSEEDEENDELS